MSVTLYTKPSCAQCDATKRQFDRVGLSYEVIDITQDPDSLDYVMSLGYMQAPVVMVNASEHWSGYRPDRIREIAARVA